MPTFGGIVVPTSAETSGRRTLLDVVDELARPIEVDDPTVRALAGDAFRAAVRTMNRKGLWPWEIMSETLQLTTNISRVSVQGAIKRPLSMHFTTNGVPDRRIGYMEYDRFVEKYNENIAGQPHTYTVPNLFENGVVQYFPIPSGNYTCQFDFYRVTPAPRVESEAIEVPDHALECYMAYARYELMKRLPSNQQAFPAVAAMADARMAFRELSHHVSQPGDRSRQTDVIHG